jgi:hypothetical protein
MKTTALTVTSKVHFTRATKGQVGLKLGPAPQPMTPPPRGACRSWRG